MTRFHLLIGPEFGINTRGLYQPLLKNKGLLSDVGIQVRIFRKFLPEIAECDVLGIDSKVFKEQWLNRSAEVLDSVDRLRGQVNSLIWFNTADSTGSIQHRVLPFVRLYCKSQLLKNMNLYKSPLYGGRVYTDFFHKNNGIHDANVQYSPVLCSSDIRDKLRLSWNYGLADGYLANHWLERCVSLIPVLGRTFWPRNRYHSPSLERPNGVFLRMQTRYARRTVAEQRIATLEALASLGGAQARVSKNKYFNELCLSQVVVSPFGWGEINIRDYETFCAGAVLLKPTMDHLKTFPNFFEENKTYIPYRWDSSDVLEKAVEILSCPSEYHAIAERAQERFKKYTDVLEGHEAFVNRVVDLLKEACSPLPESKSELVKAHPFSPASN